MPLDKREREELRAVVASELQDILRQEMAQWWAESVLALSTGKAGATPAAGPGLERVQPPAAQRGIQAPSSRVGVWLDADYLIRVAESLARTQEVIVRDMERTMERIRNILDEMDDMAERLDASNRLG